MKINKSKNQLIKLLKKDKHFSDFLKIPGKDNGFDIEGLAIKNNRLFLGLRGPVLRGWACILELNWYEDSYSIKLDEKKPYYKHFLNLYGMGIRELCFYNNDLLILAGPTLDLDGTISIFKWKNALENQSDSVHFSEDVEKIVDVVNTFSQNPGKEKAEGMCLFDDGFLVVYDSPANSRLVNEYSVKADIFII
jgi:hypothetical protein